MAKLKKEEGVIEIIIVKIKTLSFFVEESLYNPELPNIRYHVDHKIGFVPANNLVNMTIGVSYYYPEKPDNLVMSIVVENVFHIKDLLKFIPNKPPFLPVNMNIPSHVLVSITGLSIDHSRALLAQLKSGTVLEQTNLPIIDPVRAAKNFFGDKIKD